MTKKELKLKAKNALNKMSKFFGSKLFLYIILGFFVFQTSYMLVSTKKSLPPDEGNHYQAIILFVEDGIDSFWRIDHEESWRLQGANRTPNYMYHYVMGFPYRALPDALSDDQKVIVLRVFSLAFSLAGLIILAKTFDKVSKNGWIRNLSIFMLTNTIMFPFISAAVNYDSLAFLVASAMIYCFVVLLGAYNVKIFLTLLTLACFGALVKFQLLPFAAMLIIALMFHYRRDVKKVWKQSLQQIKQQRRMLLLLLVPFSLFLVLFLERYGGNYVQYGTYRPQCDEVISYDACLKSGLFVRNLSFRDEPIKNPVPSPVYVAGWVGAMKKNIYSLVGKKRTQETQVILYGSAVVWFALTAATVWKFDRKNKFVVYMLIISLAYAAVLMYFNYTLFAKSDRNLARQGRYLFPVLGLLYFVGLYHLDRLIDKKLFLRVATTLFIMIVFTIGSLPSYIYSTDKAWNTQTTKDFNNQVRTLLKKTFN